MEIFSQLLVFRREKTKIIFEFKSIRVAIFDGVWYKILASWIRVSNIFWKVGTFGPSKFSQPLLEKLVKACARASNNGSFFV